MPRRSMVRGFTLIELVVVILVMGILALGSVHFIVNSAEAYQRSLQWQGRAATARITMEKLSREIAGALPGSLRTARSLSGGACLEWMPVVAVSRYLSLPTDRAGSGFQSLPLELELGNEAVRGRVATAPATAAEFYNLQTGALSSPLAAIPGRAPQGGVVRLTRPHRFKASSPERIWFLVADPVSVCLEAGLLFRYQDYGILSRQPLPGELLPEGVPRRQLLARGVRAEGGSPFKVQPDRLGRTLARLDLSFAEEPSGLRLTREVPLIHVFQSP